MAVEARPVNTQRERLETAIFGLHDGREHSLADFLERLKQRLGDDLFTGFVDHDAHGRLSVHVHGHIIGDETDFCAVFSDGIDVQRERERWSSGGDDELIEARSATDDMAVLIDVPEFVEDVERVAHVRRAPLVRLRVLDECKSGRRHAAGNVRGTLYPVLIGRWSHARNGECRLVRGQTSIFFDHLPGEVVEGRAHVVKELADQGMHPNFWRDVPRADEHGSVLTLRIELTADAIRAATIVGAQVPLDRLEVLVCAPESVPDVVEDT
jgi:hypothetical protein